MIEDDSGAVRDVLYDKYVGYAVEAGQETNMTYLIPGMIDVGSALFL